LSQGDHSPTRSPERTAPKGEAPGADATNHLQPPAAAAAAGDAPEEAVGRGQGQPRPQRGHRQARELVARPRRRQLHHRREDGPL